jgi:hypothetical protein
MWTVRTRGCEASQRRRAAFMDAVEAIRAKIPQFQGYADETTRRLSDELVRSYLGEALALLRERHPDFFAQRSDAFETLLLRAGFMNQQAFHSFEYAHLDETDQAAIAAADLSLIQLADRTSTIDAAGIPDFLNDLTAAFDKRDLLMSSESPQQR